ncbi:stretch-activated Ca-permeable channel [Thermothelomyces thermophilus ATCC 42464]|uniref:Stretch-activated Ca-permeable channel n=1 Tax=Thermothelomyces thermophilus (strain ATCC 42464 / BCRC 31852 / DSM 1799) TaxID=573729 RepID=G2Q9E8_THET4|nr:stretch-activated Ca-permeable channel [Thermothelomyces thermophilus ATCC 42464]AEO56407.1 stretch-activated Ca-permeable channel [Thermothelomyces thermophilus ATCC 42464]
MHLSPLQSRLVASLAASCLLILLYLILFPPSFALAAELNDAFPAVSDDLDFSIDPAVLNNRDPMYEPEFSAFDRSITGRVPEGVTPLTDNEPLPMNIQPGSTQLFVFVLPSGSPGEEDGRRHELRGEHNASREATAGAGATEQAKGTFEDGQGIGKRQAKQTVYISANTCDRPLPVDPSKTTQDAPQLTLFVSTSAENQAPGPLADQGSQDVVVFNEGAVMYSFNTDGEVYLGVYAPNVSDSFSTKPYNVQVVVSTDGYYFSYDDHDDADLIWVDSDSQGALLITHNLTDSTDPKLEAEIMKTQPYVLFAHNKKDRAINGLKYSYCGLYRHAQIAATKDERATPLVRTGMTKRGPGNLPKQQFFFSGLNSSAEYFGILARDGLDDGDHLATRQAAFKRGTRVFKATSFRTKSNHGNCALVIDLSFCDQIAYSVPSNPNFGNSTKLADFYDSYARSAYANFEKSLAQVPCDAPSSQRYSLVRNCTDCAAAYKDWLCSVAIPRCEDFSNTAPYLQPRAVTQPFPNGERLDAETLASMPNTTAFTASRNPRIDEVIKPGPHKELLPCDHLCYKLVQSCPASLEFGCPLPRGIGFAGNYAKHDPSVGLTCNFPGSAHFPSAGERAVLDWGLMILVLVAGSLTV